MHKLIMVYYITQNQFSPRFHFFVALFISGESDPNAVLGLKHAIIDNGISHRPFTDSYLYVSYEI